MVWAANASLNSTSPSSAAVTPLLSSRRRAARAAPMPSSCGSTPAVSVPRTRRPSPAPSSRARSTEVMTTAAAPSASKQELPAVTVPPAANTGGNRASTAAVNPRRGPSSALTVREPSGPETPGSGTISASKKPAAADARARRWLRSASASCRSRLTPKRSATFSAATPMSGSPRPGGANCARAKNSGAPTLFRRARSGAVLMLSTPPARYTPPPPAATRREARAIASSPDPHCRSTVRPGTLTGRPASRAASRATFPPPPTALPITTSATDAGATPVSVSRRRSTGASSSWASMVFRAPWARQIGVRRAAMMTGCRSSGRIRGECSAKAPDPGVVAGNPVGQQTPG